MDNSLALLNIDSSTSLPQVIKDNLNTVEDFDNLCVQLRSVDNSKSWWLADALVEYVKKIGDESLTSFAARHNLRKSTVSTYIRTAKAFPPEKRISNTSFSSHLHASYADAFDEATQAFTSETRFKWVQKAAEENLSNAILQEEIQTEKKKEQLGVDILPCSKCGKADGDILRSTFYIFGKRAHAVRLTLHPECYEEIIAYAYSS